MPLKTNWVKGETVTPADLNAIGEAVNTGGLSDAGIAALVDDPTSETKATLDTTYAPSFPDTGITYDGSGNVQTVTENGVTTTYTYNPDGSVHTDTRLGVTRTYTYDGSGNLTGIAS